MNTPVTTPRIALLLALTCIPRIMAIHHPHMVLEQDEAIGGLGAMHVLSGRPWPLFFYGSDYGFCLPETLLCAATIAVGGCCAESVKYAMLPLFLSGVFFFYLLTRRLTDEKTAFAAAALLTIIPPWHQWSMQMRGGYLVAFALSGFTCWLALRCSERVTSSGLWAAGISLGLIFHAQPFWFPGTAVFVAAVMVGNKQYQAAVTCGVVALATIVVGRMALLTYTSAALPDVQTTWHPAVIRPQPISSAVMQASTLLLDHLSSTDFGIRSTWWQSAAFAAILATAAALVICGVLACRGTLSAPLLATAVAVCGCLVSAALIVPNSRYMLPISQWAILCCVLASRAGRSVATEKPLRLAGAFVSGTIFVLTAVGLYDVWHDRRLPAERYTKTDLRLLLKAIDDRMIADCYVLNPVHQWPIIYASGETIRARWINDRDRCPRYQRAVDEAWLAGRPTALVGETSLLNLPIVNGWAGGGRGRLDPAKVVFVPGTPFFIYPDPSIQILTDLEFHTVMTAGHGG